MSRQALIISKEDNVATALKPLGEFERIQLSMADRLIDVTLSQAIPFGHKFALCTIEKGGAVIKYGEKIGTASGRILKGAHVHLHNVEGYRGRGDKHEL
jgi:altronate dehydratase small subunit